jgi:hypothetical protein
MEGLTKEVPFMKKEKKIKTLNWKYIEGSSKVTYLSYPFCLNLSMKEGSLFCFVVMRSTKLGCFRSCSWCLWKALNEEGCMGLVP